MIEPTKKLILPVHNCDDYYDDIDHALVELTQSEISTIKTMAAVVRGSKSLHRGMHKLVAFDHSVETMRADHDSGLENGRVPLVEPEYPRIECCCLNVTDCEFYWTFNPKHSSVECETELVSITELDSYDLLDAREVVQNGNE